MFKLFIATVFKDFKGEYSTINCNYAPCWIKGHLHSFKKKLNLALTWVGALEINEVIQIVFKMYN